MAAGSTPFSRPISSRRAEIGGFFRVPLGYTNLYAVCTQIGADAAPLGSVEAGFGAALEADKQLHLSGYRWMTIVLFGEALGGEFERGVGQYPTVGDEVHLVTNDDLKVIYTAGRRGQEGNNFGRADRGGVRNIGRYQRRRPRQPPLRHRRFNGRWEI